jgi:hypothetical protein
MESSGAGLADWLGAQLIVDHPALAGPPPADLEEPSQAAALLASGLILPVLDGLDEIPEHVRGPAISRINDALRPGEHVVVTCRTQQYQDAIRPRDGIEVILRAAAAVQLSSLDPEAVRSYLRDSAGGPVAKARWDPVLKLLGTETPVGQALGTPLMVGLARVIYNPRPGELAGTLRDPKELCNLGLAPPPTVAADELSRRCPRARRSPAGRCGLPVPAHRTTAPACHPRSERAASELINALGMPGNLLLPCDANEHMPVAA